MLDIELTIAKIKNNKSPGGDQVVDVTKQNERRRKRKKWYKEGVGVTCTGMYSHIVP
jgi:hypothetical protein